MAVLESDEGEEPQTFRAEILSNGRRNKTAQASQVSLELKIQGCYNKEEISLSSEFAQTDKN